MTRAGSQFDAHPGTLYNGTHYVYVSIYDNAGNFGYDEESATDVLNFVASIFARGDTKGGKKS